MTTDPTASTEASFLQRHPLVAFFALAYGLSWGTLTFYTFTGLGPVLFIAGLGPAVAAMIVTRATGDWGRWWTCVTKWRVPLRYYAFAVVAPMLLYGAASLVLLAFDESPRIPEFSELASTYLVTFAATLFFGGLEEPGWRGYALPHLQERFSPVRATLLLGLLWGLWHLPFAPLAFIVTIPLAFLYTWLFNRTGSALLCLLLHAAITPAQDHLRLVEDSAALDAVTLGILVAAAVALVIVTRGRLGAAR